MGTKSSKASQFSPESANKIDSDPRSPTPEITRTPLQNKGDNKHNITKNVDLRKTFESGDGEQKLIHNNPILSAVIKNHLQIYDPRSPSQDFERTPIVIAQKNDQIENSNISCIGEIISNEDKTDDDSVLNKDCDPIVPKNLCNGFFDLTLDEMIQNSEPQGSSTILKETSVNESQDNEGYLETNFDYIDEDKEFQDSEESITQDEKELCETLTHQLNNPTTSDLLKAQLAHYGILENDPRSPSQGIERTPIVISNVLSESAASDENVEEMSDDKLIKVLQNTNDLLRQISNTNKDGLLIYEDESVNVPDSPRKTTTNGNGCRTPLTCMKNKSEGTHSRSKSVNTLTDSKANNPSKIPRRVSHIPRLKSLSKASNMSSNSSSVSLKSLTTTGHIGGDCENTPPHSHRDTAHKWDKDTSIVL